MVKNRFVANIVEAGKRKLKMETFPRQHARTRRFTVGVPRSFSIASEVNLITFLQSPSGSNPINKLWAHDPESQTSHIVADPKNLIMLGGEYTAPMEEQSRRERVRELGSGIVSYSSCLLYTSDAADE